MTSLITSAPLADVVFVCVSQTLFRPFIPTGSMALGPVGVLAIRASHAPPWLAREFDQGEITAQDVDDREIKELVALVAAGYAAVVTRERTRFMHVPTSLSAPLGFNGDEDGDGDDDEGGDDDDDGDDKGGDEDGDDDEGEGDGEGEGDDGDDDEGEGGGEPGLSRKRVRFA